MNDYERILALLIEAAKKSNEKAVLSESREVPIGISNRHIHLCQEDLDSLFGKGYELTKIKDLSQPAQYACKETVTVCGPGGVVEKVRILGPVRSRTQVEILAADCFKLGIKAQIRQSGDTDGTPGVTLVGPKGAVTTKDGVIIALRHIHMTLAQAEKFGVKDGQCVDVKITGIRGGTLSNMLIRANDSFALECHLDTEEANAMGVSPSTKIIL